MININWKILDLITVPEEGGNSNVVTAVRYRCRADEYIEHPTDPLGHQWYFEDEVSGVEIPLGDGAFTAYQDLTQDQVLQWVFDNIDKDAIEAKVTAGIEAQKQPAEVRLGMPW